MKELMALLKKKAEAKDGRLSAEQAKARMAVLEELKNLMHTEMAKDLPNKENMLSAHIEAENPSDLEEGLEKAKDAIPAITQAMKRNTEEIAGEAANHNLEPDVNEEKDDDMMKNAGGLDAMQEEEEMEPADDVEEESADLESKLKKKK